MPRAPVARFRGCSCADQMSVSLPERVLRPGCASLRGNLTRAREAPSRAHNRQAAAVQIGDPLESPQSRRLGDLGSDSDDAASERPRQSRLTPATRLLRQGEGESEVIVGAAPSAAVDDPQASTQPHDALLLRAEGVAQTTQEPGASIGRWDNSSWAWPNDAQIWDSALDRGHISCGLSHRHSNSDYLTALCNGLGYARQ